MATLTIPNLPEGIYRALRERAEMNKHSLAEEVSEILQQSVAPKGSLHLGDALASLALENGLENEDFQSITQLKAHQPAEPYKI